MKREDGRAGDGGVMAVVSTSGIEVVIIRAIGANAFGGVVGDVAAIGRVALLLG